MSRHGFRAAALAAFLAVAGGLLAVPFAQARFTEDDEAGTGRAVAKALAVGRAAVEANDWPRAVKSFRQAVDAEPGHADAWSMLGFSFRKAGELEPALWAYDRALAIDPQHGDALAYLGEAYLAIGRPDEARKLLTRLEKACATYIAAVGGNCEPLDDLLAAIDAHEAGRFDSTAKDAGDW